VLQGFSSQLTMLDRAGSGTSSSMGGGDFVPDDAGSDFGSSGPAPRRQPAVAAAGGGGRGDMNDEIPF
jgi:single-strand DNA-binding protein